MIAGVAVATVQVLIGIGLASLRLPVETADGDDALVVEFLHRRGRIVDPPSHRAIAPPADRFASAPRLRGVAAVRQVAEASAAVDPASSDGSVTAKPLDLRVPEIPQSSPAQGRQAAFERSTPLPTARTRFADAWVPEGDALRQASFRSPVVGFAIGAFGGPPRRCNEVERRLRKVNCLPLHGAEEDDEAARRGLDP